MNEVIDMNNKKRLKIYYSLLVTVLCIIGVSFAWFRLYLSQSEDNTIASRTCFDVSLTENTSKIEITDAFPISDLSGLNEEPFTFTLKNNCDSYTKAYITVDSTYRTSNDQSYLIDDYIKVNLSSKDTTDGISFILSNLTLTALENNRKGYIIKTTYLKPYEEKSYDLRVWMDSETTLNQGLNKNWAGKIVVLSEASKEAAPEGWYSANNGTLLASLRQNTSVTDPLTTPGAEPNAYTLDDVETFTSGVLSTWQSYYITYGTGWEANGTKFNLTGTAVTSDTYANSYSSLVGKYIVSIHMPETGSSIAGLMAPAINLSSVYYVVSATTTEITYKILSSNKNVSEAIVASTEDDYGTSYYYRGSVNNNYVQFANKCWRIVRIDGDGSIKLILHNDNTSNSSSPCSSSNNSITAAFAHYDGDTYRSDFNSNFHDNAYIGFMYGAIGASDYASTHANTNKSTILTNLETWYTNNLVSYESKLADTIWCNDKSTVSGGLGYGTNASDYAAYNRIYSNKTPTLICPEDNNGGKLSKFTVDDTTNGNGNLTYKIGLLTADEIAFAGYAYNLSNPTSYLRENASEDYWWSLSPEGFYGNYPFGWYVNGGFGSVDSDIYEEFSLGVRPSISLVSDITISGGSGTSEDPYVVN